MKEEKQAGSFKGEKPQEWVGADENQNVQPPESLSREPFSPLGCYSRFSAPEPTHAHPEAPEPTRNRRTPELQSALQVEAP